MSDRLLHVVDGLELDDAVEASVERVAEAAEGDLAKERARCRAAHEALDAALEVDVPDRVAVLAASRAFAAAEQRMKERELLLVVEIAGIIGPEAWAEVRDQLPPPGAPPAPPGAPRAPPAAPPPPERGN